MATFQITAQDGHVYKIDGPDTLTDAQAYAALLQQYPNAGKPSPQAPMSFSDTAIQAAQGGLGAIKSLVSGVGGVDSSAYRGLGSLEKQLGAAISPERQAEMQRRETRMEQAAKSGSATEEIGAGLGAVVEAPVQSTAQALGSSLPAVLAGIGVGALGAAVGAPVAIAAAVGIGTKFLLGALQGAGEVKGGIYENVQRELTSSGMDPAQAKKQAMAAQDYLGKNWGNIATAAGVGAVAGGTGIEKTLTSKLAKPIAQRAAKETLAGAALKEALPEAIQAGQAKRAENVALTREGVETPELQGVLGAMAQEGAMGGLGGAGAHAIPGRGQAQATPAPAQPQAPTAPRDTTPRATAEEIAKRQQALAAIQARKAVAPLYPDGTPTPATGPAVVAEEPESAPAPTKRVVAATSMRAPFSAELEKAPFYAEAKPFLSSKPGKGFLTKLAATDPALLADPAQRDAVVASLMPKRSKFADQAADVVGYLFPMQGAVAPAEPAPVAEAKPAEPTPASPAPAPVAEPTPAEPIPASPAPAPVAEAKPAEPAPASPLTALTDDELLTQFAQTNAQYAAGAKRPPKGKAATPEALEAYRANIGLAEQQTAFGAEARRRGLAIPDWVAQGGTAPAPTLTTEPANVQVPTETEAATGTEGGLPPTGVASKPVEATGVAAEQTTAESEDPVAAEWDSEWAYEAGQPKFAELSPRLQRRVRSLMQVNKLGEAFDKIIEEARPAMSRTERAGPRLQKAEVQGVADTVRARWTNAPEVRVVESMDDPDVPQAVRDLDKRQREGGAKGEPEAFWHDGTAYLVASQMRNSTDAIKAMFHEILGHYGLRGTFGKALNPILQQVATVRRAEMDAVAKKYGLDLNEEPQRMEAAEEVLANLAATQPELGFVQRAVAAIRSWLRQNVPGFQSLKLTDAEIINDFILPARRFVESGTRRAAPKAAPAMSRKPVDPDLRDWAQDIKHKDKTLGEMAKGSVDAVVNRLFNRKDSVGLIDIVRSVTADRLAVVETRINNGITNNMPRDVLGNTSSVVKARQADDVGKLMMAMFEDGTIRIGPDSGMLEIVKLDKPANSMNEVIARWGEQRGMDFNEAKATASRVLEAMRANELIKANAAGEADVLIHIRKPSGAIDYDRIAKAVEEYNNSPELQELSEIMDGVRVPILDELYKSGRLTAEQTRKLREVAYYVPFDRMSEEGVESMFRELKKPGKSGYSALMRIPELKGSVERQVGDVFENYYRTVTWLASELAKQNAASSLMTDLESLGVAEHITEAQAKNTPYVAKVYEKGEVQYFKLPSKYDLIPFVDRRNGLWSITGPLAKIANVLRLSITANPVFAASQVVMDVQGALIFADVKNPVHFVAAAAKNFGQVAAGETYNAVRALFGKPPIIPELERQMSRIGLAGEIDYVYANPALDALYEAGVRKRRLLGSTTAGAVFHSLQQITNGADLAVRKALYDDAMRRYNDPIMASTKARELINFRRRGSSEVLKNLVPMVPFLNAYIQATDLVYRSVTGKGNIMGRPAAEARKRLAIAATMYAGVTFIYALTNSSDDDEDKEFRQVDERTRNNNFLLPGGVRIRVRPDYGVIKVGVEKSVEWWTRQGTPDELAGKQAFKLWFTAALDAFTPNGPPVPAALAPLMEIMTNYSMFTGRQLVGTYQSKLDPSRQITRNTSEIAKTISEWVRETTTVEVSPTHIDHAIRGYLGTVGATVSMAVDKVLNPDRLDRPLHQMAVLGAFTWDETQRTGPLDEFYDLAKELDMRKKTYDDLVRDDPQEALRYMKKHGAEIATEARTANTLRELGAVRERMNYLDSKQGIADIPNKAEREESAKALRAYQLELVAGIRMVKKELEAYKVEHRREVEAEARTNTSARL